MRNAPRPMMNSHHTHTWRATPDGPRLRLALRRERPTATRAQTACTRRPHHYRVSDLLGSINFEATSIIYNFVQAWTTTSGRRISINRRRGCRVVERDVDTVEKRTVRARPRADQNGVFGSVHACSLRRRHKRSVMGLAPLWCSTVRAWPDDSQAGDANGWLAAEQMPRQRLDHGRSKAVAHRRRVARNVELLETAGSVAERRPGGVG
eukprot:4542285-Prymnesium_polylepis.1